MVVVVVVAWQVVNKAREKANNNKDSTLALGRWIAMAVLDIAISTTGSSVGPADTTPTAVETTIVLTTAEVIWNSWEVDT